MDWAEDLKMTLKKSAKKGRRAAGSISNTTTTTTTHSNNSSTDKPGSGSSISPPVEPEQGGSFDGDIGQVLDEFDLKQLSKSKKIGSWADESTKFGKQNKSNTNLIEQERFNSITTTTTNYSDEDIPVIPDLDDIRDELLLNEMVEAPIVAINRVATYNELNSDLLKQGTFSLLEDVDLTILGRCLQPENALNEPDEIWTWEKLFTEVSAEIHAEKPGSTMDVGMSQLTI